MPEMPTQPLPPAPVPETQEPEIHVIPEIYYGAALKAKVPEKVVKPEPQQVQVIAPPPRRKTGLIIALCLIGVLMVGGGFVYFNQGLFFPKPVPTPQVVVQPPPPPPEPPAAPENVTATSTNPQSVAVSWSDTVSDESGFRLERGADADPFQALTSLPQNSTSFLDVSVEPGKTYRYRVIALNQGGESQPSVEVAATVPTPPPLPPEQPKLPPAGLDSDSDGVSDVEEALFSTNVQLPDTDADGFLDGNEVFHLYNPNGRAPAKLLDAKLAKSFFGTIGWSMIMPTPWNVTVTGDGSSATVTSGHGETFTLTIESNPKQMPVVEWYLSTHAQVQASQVLQYRSKRGYQGIIGADLLSTYIPWGDRIFVFTYDLGGQPFINFRTTYSMMLNSLELRGLPQLSPSASGTPLPFEPAATSTGVVAQPVPVAVFPSVTSSESVATTTLP